MVCIDRRWHHLTLNFRSRLPVRYRTPGLRPRQTYILWHLSHSSSNADCSCRHNIGCNCSSVVKSCSISRMANNFERRDRKYKSCINSKMGTFAKNSCVYVWNNEMETNIASKSFSQCYKPAWDWWIFIRKGYTIFIFNRWNCNGSKIFSRAIYIWSNTISYRRRMFEGIAFQHTNSYL